jgi:hypothetical protein
MDLHDDDALLSALPDHISIGSLLKATPKTEGADRFIYIEASNEKRDQQGEIVLAKALEASAEYYLKFGNLDIDHYTQIGAKQGIPNYNSFEIGVPVAVRVERGSTFVKGHIKQGTGLAALKANEFWSSLTEVSPPERWYPSVGGAVIGREISVDPLTKSRVATINAVRWSNIGFSKTPVNDNLEQVKTAPFGPLAKSWAAALEKSLTAGYGTDSATLTGGGALRGANGSPGGAFDYDRDFRDQFAQCLYTGEVAGMKLPALVQFCRLRFGLSASDASDYLERFLDEFQRGLNGAKQS